MRFSTNWITAPGKALGRALDQRRERKSTLHLWFAWRPAYIGNGEWVWLETVKRRSIRDANGFYWIVLPLQ